MCLHTHNSKNIHTWVKIRSILESPCQALGVPSKKWGLRNIFQGLFMIRFWSGAWVLVPSALPFSHSSWTWRGLDSMYSNYRLGTSLRTVKTGGHKQNCEVCLLWRWVFYPIRGSDSKRLVHGRSGGIWRNGNDRDDRDNQECQEPHVAAGIG
jgi:hypothetical protein